MKQGISKELSTHIWKLKRLDGIPYLQGGELFLISRPSLKEIDVPKLAHILRQKTLPSAQRLGQLLAAREVLEVDGGRLGRWVHQLNLLQNSPDLQRLIDSGVAPLKRYQGEDISLRLARAGETIERLKSIRAEDKTSDALLEVGPDRLDFQTEHLEKLSREVAWIPRYLYRVGLIFGPDTAQVLINHAFAGALAVVARNEVLNSRIERFVESVKNWRADTHQSLVRSIANALSSALGEHPNQPSQRALIRAGQGAQSSEDIAQKMCEQWKLTLDNGAVEFKNTTYLSALPLHHPGLALPGLHGLKRDHINGLHDIFKTLPPERLSSVWPAILEHPDVLTKSWLGMGFLERDLNAAQVGFVAAHPALHRDTGYWGKDDRVIRKYLDFLQELHAEDLLPKLELDSGWLRKLFESGNDTEQTLALTRALRSQESGPVLAARLHVLSRAVHEDNVLQRALRRWETVVASPSPELLRDFVTTPESEQMLRQYLHHRALAGEGDTPSKNLTDHLECRAKLESERAWITAKLKSVSPEAPEFTALNNRLKGLSEEAMERRVIASRIRAQSLVSRAISDLKSKSLDRLLDEATCELIAQITGIPIETTALTDELRLALAVAQSEEFEPALFREFLRAALTETPIQDLNANSTWLKAESIRGTDTVKWVEGFEKRINFGDEELIVATEKTLLGAAQMGTMADTCLSLENGLYAMSALINAMDINKHVIYVKRESGERIARKLMGITQAGVVGYQLYPSDADEALRFAVDNIVHDFANQCRLKLTDEGKPAQLHGPDSGWYDDGLVPWVADIPTTEIFATPPPDWGDSLDAQVEWAFFQGRDHGDADLLSAVAWRRRRPWAELAASELLKLDQPRALRWFEVNGDYWDLPPELAKNIWFHPGFSVNMRLDLIEKTSTDSWRGLRFAACDVPLKRDLVIALGERYLRRLSQLLGSDDAYYFCGFFYDLDAFVALPLELLLKLISRSFDVRKDFNNRQIRWQLDESFEDSILLEQARLLRSAWVVEPDSKALLKSLRAAKNIEVVWVISHLLRDLDPIPGASNVLQKFLESHSRDPDADPQWTRVVMEAAAAQSGEQIAPDWETHLRNLRREAGREEDPNKVGDHLKSIAGIPLSAAQDMIVELAERLGFQNERRLHEVLRHHKRRMAHALAETLILGDQPLLETDVGGFQKLDFGMLSSKAQLRWMERTARGKKSERLLALRWFASAELPYGIASTLWFCAGDLALELNDEEAVRLAKGVSRIPAITFYSRFQVEAMFHWCRHVSDISSAVEQLRVTGGFWDEHNIQDSGPIALVDCLGHPDTHVAQVARHYLVSVLSESTPLASLMVAQRIWNSHPQSLAAPVVEDILDELFAREEERPDSEDLCDAIVPKNTWSPSIGLELARACMDRLSPEELPLVEAAFARRFPGAKTSASVDQSTLSP